MTLEHLAEKLDALGKKVDAIDTRFDALEEKVDEGFKDSKIRDEELRGLMTFGLEAREVLRDEMHRRFDDTDRKHEEELTLLKDMLAPSAQRARRLRLTRKR
jgi:hypothetical protein